MKINIKKRLEGKKFIFVYARPFNVQRQEDLIKFASTFGLKDILLIPTEKAGWGDYYGEASQLKEMGARIYKIFLDKKEFEKHIEARLKGERDINETLYKVLKKDLSKKGLIKIYKKRSEVMGGKFGESTLAPIVTDKAIVPQLKKLLKKELKKENIEKEWGIINSPTDLISIQKLQIEISKLFLEGKLNKKIPEFEKNYAWITIYKVGDKPADAEYFKSLLLGKNKKEIDHKILDIKDRISKNKEALQKLLSKIKNSQIKQLSKAVNKYLTFRTDSADTFRKIIYYSGFLFQKLFEILKKEYDEWDYNDFLDLTNKEMLNYLENGRLLELKEVKKRKDPKNYHYYLNGEFNLITSKEEKKMIKKVAGVKELGEVKEIKGNIANKGFVQGKVKIVMDTNDIKKVEEGDILVAVMTFPDFVPAMKKAKAFVTDDGGITCHAAIVSREMKKPCIIGTKIATKVLRDGDLVEVDARKGIIKILKKK